MPSSSHHPLRHLFVVAVVFAALFSAGCSTIDTYMPTLRSLGVYKLDINQGNYLSQDLVDRLKVGQTKAQVRQLLGTPLLVSPFRESRWDYVYEYTKQGRVVEHRTFTAYFVEEKLARWEGDEMPQSIAELNREALARTIGEDAWAEQGSWWDRVLDIFNK